MIAGGTGQYIYTHLFKLWIHKDSGYTVSDCWSCCWSCLYRGHSNAAAYPHNHRGSYRRYQVHTYFCQPGKSHWSEVQLVIRFPFAKYTDAFWSVGFVFVFCILSLLFWFSICYLVYWFVVYWFFYFVFLFVILFFGFVILFWGLLFCYALLCHCN